MAKDNSDLQVEALLQLSMYSYATAMNGLADVRCRERLVWLLRYYHHAA